MRKRNEKILQKLVSRFDVRWQKQAEKAVKRLYEQMKNGVPVAKAVDNLQKEYSELFKLDGLQDMMTEAACYGYGIMPTVLARGQKQAWGKELARAWDSSGMTLSEKIHGAGAKMRDEIIRTLQTQTRNNQGWMKAARALYDGYSKGKNAFTGGKDIIRQQEIPKYIQKVFLATGDAKTAAAQRQAIDKINRLASGGAPNQALQAAYDELLESVKDGNERAIQKAIQTAINERSRYVAERIARTEMARAYADGFVAKMNQDDDIVAVKFKLSGRHPTFDICDMYAKADMYNLGAGVYPKDKLPPLPVHPHCLCRYSEIYTGEVDTTKEKPRIREAGDKWLNGLTEYQRQKVLGGDGLKAWKAGKDWRKYMHGYAGFEEAKSRLTQLYKSVVLSENTIKASHATKTDGTIEFQMREIENAMWNLYVSESIKMKPKTLHQTEGYITRAMKLLRAEAELGQPQIIIASNHDIGGVAGSYNAKENKLYLNYDAITAKLDKGTGTHLDIQAVVLHELIHWKDAREYVEKFGEISDQGEYMRYIIAKHKKSVDKLMKSGYNIGEISKYSEMMFREKRFDEVMTEYRTKNLLKGG